MANRTASVELRADVAQFKAAVLDAEKSTVSLDKKIEALDRDINKLPADATKAAAGLGLLDEAAKKTGNDLDGLGKKTSASADETGKFDTRINELKASTKSLAEEFNRTGDSSLLKKFRADSSELAGLTKMSKAFGGLADDAKKVIDPLEKITKDAEKFAAESEKAGMSLGDLGGPAMIGGIAALVPPALALAGALTTVAAAGGIAGAGIAGAIAGNPQVFKTEWGNAIGSIKNDWIDASVPFTGPTLSAIRSVGPLVDSWHLDTMFAKASTFVGPLVHGVEGFATGVEKGVAALVDKAGPEIRVLAADLPRIGNSVGTALKLISDNAEGGAQTLHDFDVALEKIVITTGAVISASEALGGALTHANAGVKGFMDSIPGWVLAIDPLLILPKELADVFTPEPFNTSAGSWGKAFSDLGNIGGGALTTIQDDAAGAAAMLDRMNQSFDKSLSDALGLSRADIQVAQGFADLTKQFEHGSDALDINSQRGRDNVTVIDQIVAGLQEQRDKSIAAAGGTQAATTAANAAYDSQLAKLGAMLLKLTGNKTAVDNLLNAFRDKTFTITQKVVTVYSNVGSVSKQGVLSGPVPRLPGSAYEHGGVRHAAEGTIVPARDPGTLIVGEPATGGEAWIPLGKSISDGKAADLAGIVGAAHNFDVAPRSSMMPSYGSRYASPSTTVVVNATVSYSGPTTGLDGLHLGWLAEASRKGQLQIHAKSVIS